MTAPYEQALAKYYNKLKIVSLPLHSWDLFVGHRQELDSYNKVQKDWQTKVNFRKIVYQEKRQILITNLQQEIVFATEGIYEMNGYRPFEVLGKSPKIFQGPLTTAVSKRNIGKAIQDQVPFKEVVFNYRKDGSTYLCEIEAYPMYNRAGALVHYIAFERLAS